MQINGNMSAYLSARRRAGKTGFAFCGSRRSGKTVFVSQFLTTRAYRGEVVNVASMTQAQGRLGAFSDFKAIIDDSQTLRTVFEVLSCPLEIRNRYNSGRVIFNSYQNSETAKGIACDWLFINEANNFTEQQVVDLRANVRNGWIIDYNPTKAHWWVENYFADEDICHSTWQDNPFLTNAQHEYFADLKRKAFAPNATELDIRNYKVNYLGEPYELHGGIFSENTLRWGEVPGSVHGWYVFADPSALRGADYFAAVLVAWGDDSVMYVADAFSVNGSHGETRESVARRLRSWCADYGARLFIETNGLVGIDFFEFAQNSGLPVEGWYSRGNKFERIISNYGNIRERVVFADTQAVRDYCKQIYDFAERCEHDDNIDAVVSAWRVCEFA